MGVNNQQRRAAKQRQRARSRAGGAGGARPPGGPGRSRPEQPGEAGPTYAALEGEVDRVVRRTAAGRTSDDDLLVQAQLLERIARPHSLVTLGAIVSGVLSRLVDHAEPRGWGRDDVDQLVRRNGGDAALAVLAAALAGRSWCTDPASLAAGLRAGGLLTMIPLLTARAVDHRVDRTVAEHPKLARVRALLAKAESTEFDAEAEALSAKAQELISRYALDRLLAQSREGLGSGAPHPRRIWLDPPYVGAKAALVTAVAQANRCRCAVDERLQFCVLVGAPGDLDAVELLVTSLLVQANAAMLRQGAHADRSGVTRTRSFRRAFLLAYAAGIMHRLTAVADQVADAVARSSDPSGDGRMLPVLRDHEKRVAEAFDALVPHRVGRAPRVGNGAGWYAGLAAADLAQLDVNAKLRG